VPSKLNRLLFWWTNVDALSKNMVGKYEIDEDFGSEI
jgi:hypothetical protein